MHVYGCKAECDAAVSSDARELAILVQRFPKCLTQLYDDNHPKELIKWGVVSPPSSGSFSP